MCRLEYWLACPCSSAYWSVCWSEFGWDLVVGVLVVVFVGTGVAVAPPVVCVGRGVAVSVGVHEGVLVGVSLGV